LQAGTAAHRHAALHEFARHDQGKARGERRHDPGHDPCAPRRNPPLARHRFHTEPVAIEIGLPQLTAQLRDESRPDGPAAFELERRRRHGSLERKHGGR
jgi:hypothetical protein